MHSSVTQYLYHMENLMTAQARPLEIWRLLNYLKKQQQMIKEKTWLGKGDIGRHDHYLLSGVIVSFYFWILCPECKLSLWIRITIYIVMSLIVVSIVFNEEMMMPQQEKRKRDTC